MMNLGRESSAAHWTQQHYENLFLPRSDENASERYAWVAEWDQNPQPEENLENESRLRGFLVAHRINDEYELENLVVATRSRRKGIGTLLLTQLLAQSRETHACSIFLEVRESNQAARKLYETFGLKIMGLRKNYYQSPQEDAVLYRFNLC